MPAKKTLFVSLLVAAGITAGVHATVNLSSILGDISRIIIFPFYIVGSVVSGNVHAPNEAAGYIAMFICFFVLLLWLLKKTQQFQ